MKVTRASLLLEDGINQKRKKAWKRKTKEPNESDFRFIQNKDSFFFIRYDDKS